MRGAQNQLTEVKLDSHNLQVSDTRYIEKVFTKVRQKLNRPEGDEMLDQKVNVLMWRLIYVNNDERSDSRDVDELSNVGHVFTHASSSQFEAQLYIFEDNEAVTKMIINGRSPTMRHVSKTNRVALDRFFDRINLDPKIQINFVDTKNQQTDMLFKDNFTREEWNHLLRLLNIMIFSMSSCNHILSIFKPNTMSKRTQERRTGEEPVVAKSRPVSLISRSLSANQSPMLDSGTSCSPGDYRFGWSSDPTSAERSVRDRVENSASRTQEWHRDDDPFSSTERSEREMNPPSGTTGRPLGGVQNQLTEVKLDHHNLQVSDTPYIEKVFTNVRQQLNRSEDDEMLDQRVNELMELIFVSNDESSDTC